jgi:hypothetical protein
MQYTLLGNGGQAKNSHLKGISRILFSVWLYKYLDEVTLLVLPLRRCRATAAEGLPCPET